MGCGVAWEKERGLGGGEKGARESVGGGREKTNRLATQPTCRAQGGQITTSAMPWWGAATGSAAMGSLDAPNAPALTHIRHA